MFPMPIPSGRLRRSWFALLIATAAVVTLPIAGVLHELGHLQSSAAKGGAPQGKITDACELCVAFTGAGHGLAGAQPAMPLPADAYQVADQPAVRTAPGSLFLLYRERAPPEFLRRR